MSITTKLKDREGELRKVVGKMGKGAYAPEEFRGMVGFAGRRVEGNGSDNLQVSHMSILQALILERRQYVNLMCKYPLVC